MGLVLLKAVLAGLFLLQADMTSKLSNKSEIFFIRIIPSNHNMKAIAKHTNLVSLR